MTGEWCAGPDARHLLVVVYRRPWWRPWRKVYALRCWECDLQVEE